MPFSQYWIMIYVILPCHQFGILYAYMTLSSSSTRIIIQIDNQIKVLSWWWLHSQLQPYTGNECIFLRIQSFNSISLFISDTVLILFHYWYSIFILNLITLISKLVFMGIMNRLEPIMTFLLCLPSPLASFS